MRAAGADGIVSNPDLPASDRRRRSVATAARGGSGGRRRRRRRNGRRRPALQHQLARAADRHRELRHLLPLVHASPNATPSCVAGVCQFTCSARLLRRRQGSDQRLRVREDQQRRRDLRRPRQRLQRHRRRRLRLHERRQQLRRLQRTCAFPFANATLHERRLHAGRLPAELLRPRPERRPAARPQCMKTNGGVEICDGLDNDCDGVVDDNLGAPPRSPASRRASARARSRPASGQNGWVCNYPATYQEIEDTKFGCDGLDNDCDGLTDEPFQIGKSCIVGTGPCAGTGTWVCDNTHGRRPPLHGLDEAAGRRDLQRHRRRLRRQGRRARLGVEPDHRRRAGLPPSGPNVTMFAYEASRYDATATSHGFDSTRRPCSVPGKLPWSNVTKEEAETACEMIGPNWRLCTAAEWQEACKGLGTTRPSRTAPATSPADCNGNDYQTGDGTRRRRPSRPAARRSCVSSHLDQPRASSSST